MNSLHELLREYLCRELSVAIDGELSSTLRVFFSGPPRTILAELFALLTSEGKVALELDSSGGLQHIPVFLLDADANDPHVVPKAAVCTDSFFVKAIRNNRDIPVCLALHECVSSIRSVDSTVTRLGIPGELSNLDEWIATPLVREILIHSLAKIVGRAGIEDALPAVRHALDEAWEADERHRDKRTTWNLLKKLCISQQVDADPHLLLSATLGLPSCGPAELGSKEQLSTLNRVADFLEQYGLRSGFDELEANAGDDLAPHLRSLRAHLDSKGVIDASEFATKTLATYCPLDANSTIVPEWWRELSVDAWSRLLDAGADSDPNGNLEVTVVNPVAAAPRGLPFLVCREIELELLIEAEEEVEVVVSRASGNATLREVARFTLSSGNPHSFTDNELPQHERFVRYKCEVEGMTPKTVKCISLDNYSPCVVAICRGALKATPFKLNRKAKDGQGRKTERYECDLRVPGVGSHQLDIFTSSRVTLSSHICGHEVDAEQPEVIERPINRVDEFHSVCLIDTDEESFYDFTLVRDDGEPETHYRIFVTAEEVEATGASSEFDRLVIAHRASARREHSNARVEAVSCRAANLEEWILEDSESYRPLVIGDDFLDTWKKPSWSEHAVLSEMSMLVDPRPDASSFNAPSEFLEARARVFECLTPPPGDPTPAAVTLRLYEYMRDGDFVDAINSLLEAYYSWLAENYDHAAWSDVIAVHGQQKGVPALHAIPYAIMLTPYHPVRLAWQCRAQEVLQRALDKHSRCPAASMLTPSGFPDCMVLPCRSATGSISQQPFAAMTTTSDYWSVLWSIDAIGGVGEKQSIFGSEFGIGVDGLASGFSAQQVVRSLDEVSRLMSAKSTLRVGISSDSAGAGSCNEGLDSWCSTNLGSDQDFWSAAGPRSIVVSDQRDSTLQPEQALLASLTARTDAAVRWFTDAQVHNAGPHDLSIIAHLGTMNHQFDKQGIRSAIDASALTRWRVRKQLPSRNATFIAESRLGDIPGTVDRDTFAGRLLSCVDEIERRCRDTMDSYVFAPNMEVIRDAVDRSWYTAVSSSNIDAACFFGPTDKAYMWDYELPSYSRRAGENCGYFLLARESKGMLIAVRSALSLLANSDDLTDESLSGLLKEISRRGMPTLKRLTTGGSMSLGEIGMLVALRFFQAEFEDDRKRPSLLPVTDPGRTLSLIVPADPFKNQFEDLRLSIDKRYGERPDLLVLSIAFDSGTPTRLRVTPVEVKARGGSMSSKERASALAQASLFGAFLSKIQSQAAASELWAVAWRSLIASLLDYGFRVYGQLEHFMQHDEWTRQHSAVLRSLSSGQLDIEVDQRGRLIVIDSVNASVAKDVDDDSFRETINLSYKDAYSLLTSGCESFMDGVKARLGCWELTPDDELDTDPETSTPTNAGDSDGNGLSNCPVDANKGATRFESADSATRQSKNVDQAVSLTRSPDETDATERDVHEATTLGGVRFPVGHTIREFAEEVTYFFPGNTALNQLNVGVVGDLGTGKTQLVQALIYQLRADPGMNRGTSPNVLIFDYKKDYSKPEFVAATGARVIEPFNIPLNLFDTRDLQHRRNAWLERSKFFSDVLDKIYSGIGPAQRQRIKTAVKEAYEGRGSVGAESPTINDVFDAYKRSRGDAVDSPYSIMSDLVDGGYFVEDSADVVPFSKFLNGIVVLDLAEVGQDDRTKNMLVVIFLNLFYEHMLRIQKHEFVGENPRLRFIDTMLLVDEADNIMQYEFDVLKKILLQGREFGVGVLLASQYLSHFKTSHENYLEPLLTWFVHKVPNISIKDLEGIGLSGVTSDLVDAIKTLECHECLFKTLGVDGRTIRATPFFELLRREDR